MENPNNNAELPGMDICPECGLPFLSYDEEHRRHICINEECGYAEDAGGESILTKLLRLLRLKRD